MSRGNTTLILGLALAGGVGYYFYQAGGDPKVAEKKLEGTTDIAAHCASCSAHPSF